jgi:hypothetical protein
MLQRLAPLAEKPVRSFFLWGSRQTGKSTLLRARYPGARWIDLLDTDALVRFTQRPALLCEEVDALPRSRLVVSDEIQKVPVLLDEVHSLIESRRQVFALCGSSARRVRRPQANLLGGRAVRYELFGLVSAELGARFDPVRRLNHGYLPPHYLAESPTALIRAYVQDDLKEEILAEGLTRNLPGFLAFSARRHRPTRARSTTRRLRATVGSRATPCAPTSIRRLTSASAVYADDYAHSLVTVDAAWLPGAVPVSDSMAVSADAPRAGSSTGLSRDAARFTLYALQHGRSFD